MNFKLQSVCDQPAEAPVPNSLETVGNRIYFYSEIERDKILALNKSIRTASQEILADRHNRALVEAASVYLHVQSFGGSVFAGLAGMDEILRCPVPVVTIVDGCAASAATFLTVVGSHRQISRNAYMLIHQLTAGAWGTFHQLADQQKNAEILMKKIIGIYDSYTKVPHKKLAEMLKHDLWWDAKQCLKYGLVDEII